MPDAGWLGSGLGLAAAGGFMAYAVRGRSSSVFGPSVYRGMGERNAIALTFDDGPSEATPRVLDLLAKHNAKATFFMCGANVARLPKIARAVVEAGHEIGNHSDTHPRFDFKSTAFILDELTRAQRTIFDETGVEPRLFRAPYGVRWFGMRAAQQQLNLLGVMWSIIGRDWRWPGDRVASRIESRARRGDIICLHDGRETNVSPNVQSTLDAVRILLPRFGQNGLHLETISELCNRTSHNA